MKIIIIYDSVFGNTREIALAIYQEVSKNHQAEMQAVNEVNPELFASAEYLIVGSPTRGFRPTPAISGFIKSLPKGSLSGKTVAAFDTRVKLDDIQSKALRFMVKTGGYAAKPILAQLVKKGGSQLGEPEGFYVKGEEGPLHEGEIERAMRWAGKLVCEIAGTREL